VRHALAVPRHAWERSDRDRPLTPRGQRQADALVGALDEHPFERILSSPAHRCSDTVLPLATDRELRVKRSKALGEGRGEDALDLVLDAIEDLVICTHGDVLHVVLAGLRELAWPLPSRPRSAKGGTWLLSPKECTYLPPAA